MSKRGDVSDESTKNASAPSKDKTSTEQDKKSKKNNNKGTEIVKIKERKYLMKQLKWFKRNTV